MGEVDNQGLVLAIRTSGTGGHQPSAERGLSALHDITTLCRVVDTLSID